jgi:cytochrome c-type biogenesis protein CcmH
VRILLAALLAGALAAPPTLSDLEDELVCPTCKTTLDLSNAPVADQMRDYIRRRIQEGATKDQIKAELVADYGPRVLAEPRKEGFDLLAWLLPIAGIVLAAGAVGVVAWRWSRAREPQDEATDASSNGRVPIAPDLERRLDEELARFDG